MFNTFSALPNTQKTNHKTIKTSKNQPKNILPRSKTTHHKLSVFLKHTVLLLQLLCFTENTIIIAFSDRHVLLKIHFYFSHFWMTTLKNTFYSFFWPFPFFSFFCFYFSNIKRKNKNAIFFSKTSFLTSPKLCKNTILAQCDTICVLKHAPKHYKNGESSENIKLGPVFNTRLGPVFNTRNPKSWTSF